MRVLGSIVLALGGTLATLALALGAPLFRTTSWLFVVPLCVGVTLALLGLIFRGRGAPPGGRRRRIWTELLGITAVVVLVQFLAVRTTTVIDLSSTARNTLSEKSVAVARALPAPVAIEARMPRDDRAFIELAALVERYRAHTEHVQIFRSDDTPGLGEPNAFAVRAQDDAPGGVRRVPLRVVAGAANHEELITNALVELTGAKTARAYFVSGHQERELVDESPAGLSRLRDALRVEGLEAVPLPLARMERVPEDAALVVVAGPSQPVPAEDHKKLRTFVDGGGRLLLLVEPVVEGVADSGLDGLAGAYGVQIGYGMLVDESPLSGLAGGPETATGSQLEHRHPVTRPLGDSLTHFARARPLAENPGTEAKVTALVLTGAEAYADLDAPDANGAHARGPDDVAGPLALAMASEDVLPSHVDGKSARARLVVIGDTTCAENRGIGFGANRDLLVNAALWLAERDDKIAIRPIGRGGSLLLLTPSGRERLVFVLLYLIPALLVALGVGIRGWRRR